MSVFFYGCVTLDGYLADKNHRLDWLHQTGTVEETGYEDFYRRMDIAVMGRRTFREMEGLEHPEEAYPSTVNYVFTHEKAFRRKGFLRAEGDAADFVRGLPREKNIWVIGGGAILGPLLEAELMDHMVVQIAPVLLGEGIPLFPRKEHFLRFHLDEVKQYGQFAELTYSRRQE